jgi:hypothetical protein
MDNFMDDGNSYFWLKLFQCFLQCFLQFSQQNFPVDPFHSVTRLSTKAIRPEMFLEI